MSELERTDREVLDAVVAAWDARLLTAAPLGREVGSRGVITGWRIQVADRGGAETEHVLYLEDGQSGEEPGPGVLRVVDETGTERRVWRYPEDPVLQPLPAVVYPDAAAVVLQRLGVEARISSLRLAAYRPGKRAVVQLRTTAGDLFVKVVPAEQARGILERHRQWRTAGLPSPPALAWSPQGLVVLGALAGVEATEVVDRVDPARLADSIGTLRRAIAAVPSTRFARRSLATRLDWYRDRTLRLAPDLEAAVREATTIAAARRDAGGPAPATATVHGDLHLRQLLVEPTEPECIVGILDIDTAGLGDPADDDGAIWAHLAVMGEGGRAGAGRLAALLQSAWADAGSAHRDRTAAVAAALLLGHGLSGHLPVARAVDLAAAIAAAPDENPLTSASSSSHPPSRT